MGYDDNNEHELVFVSLVIIVIGSYWARPYAMAANKTINDKDNIVVVIVIVIVIVTIVLVTVIVIIVAVIVIVIIVIVILVIIILS